MGPVNGTTYTVVLGDTLFSIARRFCTTTQQLAASNGIPNPWLIFAGQHLTVPIGSLSHADAALDDTDAHATIDDAYTHAHHRKST